ncbi:MAG: hypothetical protein KIT36_18300, partial [Alphaproteobacteria bacterium]|nr:hypothetical protein [Alphaproteobacteria bacterium]
MRLAGGLASLGAAQTGWSGGAAAQDMRTLTIAWDSDIDSTDPAVFKSIAAYVVQANVYDSPLMWKVEPEPGKAGLFRSRPNEFVGSAAESWSFENNGATLVLKVRPGMKFPSGRPVNAHSFKYLFDRGLQSPGYMRLLFPTLLDISKPEQFVVRDDMTFAIEMPSANPMTLDIMSIGNNALIDPEEVKAHATTADPWAAEWMKRNVAGLGPST